ncbi:sigma-54-dependent transcriptional regulator [Thiolapillus brandeum]|uniref:Two-component system response regulator CbrB n=1 Tax=Thiolapillus brandeum TaxID=1076588 RepID=A0A7U6GI16_9GAMM|nr:sigma-54 dependent transcriptional regulator [Thiolapillus brandeum]BAO43994.1 two-component system response regulator CbrB [Thiolapillus brandeum]
MNRILIVEDEQVIRDAVSKLLKRNGYEASTAASVEEALKAHDLTDFHLLIVDIRLPGKPGTDLITLASPVPVLIMTSYASVSSAVEAMKQGAADYIAKPFDHEELLLVIEQILRQHRQERVRQALEQDVEETWPTTDIIGESPAMQAVFHYIRKVAPTTAGVLILGESGTGKELVARAIHAHSPRKDAPFVAVNCAAIPENLVESELFGHVKGAYTGAEQARTGLIQSADSGTLFLDEIAELPLSIQARLLRVLQDGELRRVGSEKTLRVDVRILAATNRNLQQMVDQGDFRSDLFFRLQVVELRMPPLRERGDDLALLVKHLLHKTCKRLNRPCMDLADGALESLRNYHWPGNIRELENAIERAAILSDGELVTVEALGIPLDTSVPREKPDSNLSLEDYFVQFVIQNQEHMTETELARQLGISRKTLWQKRQRLGIPRPGQQEP